MKLVRLARTHAIGFGKKDLNLILQLLIRGITVQKFDRLWMLAYTSKDTAGIWLIHKFHR